MSYLETKLAILDYKIDELVSRKNRIDIRLMELYEEREDLVVEYELQSKKHHCCEECSND